MNVKTEWGGAKIPGILVSQPKGVSRIREPDSRMKEDREDKGRFVSKKGTKRIAYNGDDTTKRREEVDEQSQPRPDVHGVAKRRRRRQQPQQRL